MVWVLFFNDAGASKAEQQPGTETELRVILGDERGAAREREVGSRRPFPARVRVILHAAPDAEARGELEALGEREACIPSLSRLTLAQTMSGSR